jgi:hypothetical protein
MKILPMRTELFHVDGRTERHTAKVIVVFRGFSKAPKNEAFEANLSQCHFAHHSSLRSGTTETHK